MTSQYFTEIVNIYANRLYGYILKMGVPAQETDDIMQNCYEALWKTNLIDEASCGKYLFGVAYNQCVNYWRINKRNLFLENMPEQINKAEQPLLKKQIHIALNILTEQQRSLIMLKDYEGYSYQEIEKIMGLESNQVKVYLHRARQKMQNHIGSLQNII
jgi:RNA polymerase sigma factor (sigma-70 family)